MKKTLPFVAFLLIGYLTFAQVGIGNTDPNATLDISATNIAAPSNTDGILIPRIDDFPTTNPTTAQDGMMVFVTGNGTPAKGFYYWNQGTTSWVSFNGSSDADWFVDGTTNVPATITDDIYTQGNVEIDQGVLTLDPIDDQSGGLSLSKNVTNNTSFTYRNIEALSNITGSTAVWQFQSGFTGNGSGGRAGYVTLFNGSGATNSAGLYNSFNNDSANSMTGINNAFFSTSSGQKMGLFNNFSINSQNNIVYGVRNLVSGGTGTVYGSRTEITNGSGTQYGSYHTLTNGTGTRYGFRTELNGTGGGVDYGVYSDVEDTSNGYAGYFIGRTSLGTGTTNRYLMPATDGTNGQVMTSDGSGNITFQDVPGGDDADWYQVGTTTAPTSIISQKYTQGRLKIGNNSAPNGIFEIEGSFASEDETFRTSNSGSRSGDAYAMSNVFNSTASASTNLVGVNNEFNNTGTTLFTYGLRNDFAGIQNSSNIIGAITRFVGNNNGVLNRTGYITQILGGNNTTTGFRTTANSNYTVNGTITGINNFIGPSGSGTRYGVRNYIQGAGSATKYGTHNTIDVTAGGTHYGVYSEVLKSGSYAGYFLGNVTIGTTTGNTYTLPASRGTNGQVMTTDGAGNVTFQTPSDDGDWTTVGADIERQSGDVYIGNDATTDNDLYISDRLVDWDDTAYFINPAEENRINEITFDDGSGTDPSIHFGVDTNTGFFRSETDGIGFTSNGTTRLQLSPRGQIEYNNTGRSVFIGNSAGEVDDFSDNDNVGIGYFSMRFNTTGSSNTALGSLALRDNTSGRRNVALGYAALAENETGEYNVSIGSNNLSNNVDGDSNMAMGYLALGDNVSGSDNIAIGHQALTDNLADRNIGIGDAAGNRITTGTRNIGIGYRAQAAHTGGDNNIAIGDASLDTMTSTTINSNNVAVGVSTMSNLTEAEDNVAIGNFALFGNGNGSPNFASQNVALGAGAGQSNEGNGNIFIGYEAGQLEGVSSNKLFIENSNGDQDNALIYGEFDNNILRTNSEFQIGNPTGSGFAFPTTDGTANQILETDGNGQLSWVSPATSTPTASNGLSIGGGDVQLGGTLSQNTTITQGNFDLNFNVNSSSGLFSVATDGLVVENTGQVGIGLTNPGYQLEVADNPAGFIANFTNGNTAATADGIRIELSATNPNASGYYIGFYSGGGATPNGRITGNGSGGVIYNTASDDRLKMNKEGVKGALDLVMKTKPTIYEFIKAPGRKEMGFIAQELQQVYPQAVSGDPHGNVLEEPMMVDYGRLTPLLTASIQELNEKVEKLSEENKELKKQLEVYSSLEARISQLENGAQKNTNTAISTEKK